MNENGSALIPDHDVPPCVGTLPPIADHQRGLKTTVPGVIPSVGHIQAFASGDVRGKMRAADADRDRVVELLNTAYTEGRLFNDEYDARLESALSARTYADLDQLVNDLPAARATVVPSVATRTVVTPVANTNGLAIASLVCGLAQFVVGPVATIPAIILGHMARYQIKRSAEKGAGLALAGLTLGWAAVILGIVVIVIGLVIAAGVRGTMPMQ